MVARKDSGVQAELVAGRIPVLECLRVGRRAAHRLFVLKSSKGLDSILDAAGDIPVEWCTRGDLDQRVKGLNHQGVVLEASPLPVIRAETWLAENSEPLSLVVLLDGVEDPQNFGAIVRTSAACGVDAVVFPKDRAAPVSPASVKSAAGAMEHIRLVRATNLVRTIEALKDRGLWIAALDPDGPDSLWDTDLTMGLGLVIGGEGKGLRRLVGETCDLRLRIPMPGPITTLNASVSAAMALGEVLRQRST